VELKNILTGLDIVKVYNDANPDITHITNNSRECKAGSLFFAVRGFATDGHKYIDSAVKNGAVAVICEEYNGDYDVTQIVVKNSRRSEAVAASNFYGEPHKNFRLLGVTGTNGKTTVTYLLKHILEHIGKKVGLIGTNQNMIGDDAFETGRTTPDSIELQGIFKKMSDAKVDYCIMEVSSHALDLDRVYGCRFHAGAFTNLTQDHLDFHKTMDNYALAKSKLFAMSDNAVINADDMYCQTMTSKAKGNIITYSSSDDAILKAENINLSAKGVSFTLSGEEIFLGIPGEFSVYNALCAIGMALSCDVNIEDIKQALLTAHGVKGRAEVVKTNTDYTVLIDYAHTPDGIENILKTVKGFAKGRTVIVFGCGGDRDNTKRPIMGKIAGEIADFCIVTSDNPRSEDPMRIISMVEEGVKQSGAEYVVIESRYNAIEYALLNAKKDDVIVLAGKGHETYQILNSGTIHFDEREVIKEILEKNGIM